MRERKVGCDYEFPAYVRNPHIHVAQARAERVRVWVRACTCARAWRTGVRKGRVGACARIAHAGAGYRYSRSTKYVESSYGVQ